jgi:hypothetical protein
VLAVEEEEVGVVVVDVVEEVDDNSQIKKNWRKCVILNMMLLCNYINLRLYSI